MSGTNVSSVILERLAGELPGLTPEARKAATYVLENPQDIGVLTVREIAQAAQVKPNTVMRMVRQVGFEGYDDFRAPFRNEIRQGTASFPDRALWLQEIKASGDLGGLYADMVAQTLANLETTFEGISARKLSQAGQLIWNSRRIMTLGVGVNNANAQNFTYLASTGMVDFQAIPRPGSTPTDDLAWADHRDTLIAITHKPYRAEVIETVNQAKEQGVKVIALSDSPASPIMQAADFAFQTNVETPQFFPSSVATIAVLEMILSFVVAHSGAEIVDRVERFHARRHALGLYQGDGL